MEINEILKEILENNPELKDDEKKIKKIIKSLIEANPNIKPDNNFKEKLKERLNNIIIIGKENEQKSIKKTLFFAWLVPGFSLFFLIASFYYYFGGTTFFHINNGQNLPKNNTVIDNNNKQNIDNNENNKTKINVDKITTEQKKQEKIKVNQINGKTNINEGKNSDIIINENQEISSPLMKKIENDNISNNNNSIDDNQIIDILGEPTGGEQGLGNDGFAGGTESYSLKSIAPNLMIEDTSYQCDATTTTETDSLNDCNTISNSGITDNNTNTGTINFSTFCANNFGEIIKLDGENICIVDEKTCFESEYTDGKCNFSEIK